MKEIYLLFLPEDKWSLGNFTLEITYRWTARKEVQTWLLFPEANSQDFKTSADRSLQMQTSSEKEKEPTSEYNYLFSIWVVINCNSEWENR